LSLENQYVGFQQSVLQATCLATGLPPGVLLATLYLAKADNVVVQALSSSPTFRFYHRYVDDSIICGAPTDIQLGFSLLQSWSYLNWEITDTGVSIVFLDRRLGFENNAIISNMHVKPRNLHLYISPGSCHTEASFRSLVVGGLTRIFRCCSKGGDVDIHIKAFLQQLVDRGHNVHKTRDQMSRTLSKLRSGPRTRVQRKRQHYFVTSFSSSVNRQVLKSHLKCFSYMIGRDIQLSFKVQPNLFRLLHNSNWPE
jgi:hypothetical protein